LGINLSFSRFLQDFLNGQANIPTILGMVEQIHGAKEQLLTLWNQKQAKLDQCFQLRHFEQDCKKVIKFTLLN